MRQAAGSGPLTACRLLPHGKPSHSKDPGEGCWGFAGIWPGWLYVSHLDLMLWGPQAQWVQILGPQKPAAPSVAPGTGPPPAGSASVHPGQHFRIVNGPAGKPHDGFPLAAALDPTCLVELSKRARGSLKAKCRLLEDDIYDPGPMIS